MVFGILVFCGIAILALGLSVLVFPIQPTTGGSGGSSPPSQAPGVTITLYAGEVGTSLGYGLSANNITSPGPTLYVNYSEIVKVNLINVGIMPHAFEVTNVAATNSTMLFNSAIGSATDPISPGGSGSVTFTANQNGTFYYMCPVPGHVEAGMWGEFIVG
jgi:nitrite reductase (NO-forming)